MDAVKVLDEDNSAAHGIRIIHKESLRRKLADISNLEGEQMKREETQQQQQAMLFSSKEYAAKLQKFVLDAANPDGVQSKRQYVRRKSTRVDVQGSEQTETVPEIVDAKETKETARICLKRRSARLRPEEAEPCKSFHERNEVKEMIKRRRVSSRKESATLDLQEPELTETLRADVARSGAIEPSESRHETEDTKGHNKKVISKGWISNSYRRRCSDRLVFTHQHRPEYDLLPSRVSQEDHKRESKNRPKAEETGGMMRRTSIRHFKGESPIIQRSLT